MPRWQAYAIVGLISAIVVLTNLGGARLWDRDEPRNAGCAAEMLARGDWIVPVFNAELRTHKPVLLYWFMMVAYQLFGVTEFAARLPSALMAIGTALCTFEMGRHLFSPRAGIWAGIAVATSLMFVVAGRAATPDATLIFCSTLSVTIFALGIKTGISDAGVCVSERRDRGLTWPRAASMFAAMGLATLAKGPVGFVLPSAVIGLFQLLTSGQSLPATRVGWQERCLDLIGRFTPRCLWRAFWNLRPLTACIVILAVAAPWYVWVGIRTDGEFLRGFFLEHNLNRAMSTMEGHRGNVLFYPLTLLVGLFPWSVLAAPLIIDLTRRPWSRLSETRTPAPQSTPDSFQNVAGYLLAGCWLAVYLGVFSLAKTKLPSYVTPCYPAVAILIGAFIDRWVRGAVRVRDGWMQAACGTLALIGVILMAAIPIATREKLPGEEWLALIGLVPLCAGLLAWWFVRREERRRAAWCIASAATAFATLLFAVGADRASRHQLNHRLIDVIHENSDHPRIAAFGCLEPSWVFYGSHPIDEITEGDIHPTHSPFVAVNGRWEKKPPVRIEEIASEKQAFLITTSQTLDAARKLLPDDFQVLETIPLFLKNEELILLGRRNPFTVVAQRSKR